MWLDGFVFIQARASLELMMERQLELRKEETRAIHEFVQSLIEDSGLNERCMQEV